MTTSIPIGVFLKEVEDLLSLQFWNVVIKTRDKRKKLTYRRQRVFILFIIFSFHSIEKILSVIKLTLGCLTFHFHSSISIQSTTSRTS